MTDEDLDSKSTEKVRRLNKSALNGYRLARKEAEHLEKIATKIEHEAPFQAERDRREAEHWKFRAERQIKEYDKTQKELRKRGASTCYLTTACVDVMGLPDDCFELETLRGFRNIILLSEPSGRRAVREYYRIAPEIIQAVEEQEQHNAPKVWHSIYNDIRKAVSLVLSNDFEGAFQHYQQMTSRLKEKYLD